MKKQKLTPFLSFTGKAEKAMRFYESILPEAEIIKITRYGKDHPHAAADEENNVYHGLLSFMGQELMFLDMPAAYPAPAFSWATSLYIDCCDEAEFDTVFQALSKEGTVMMGPEPVAHLRKCAWITDKFGITWQPAWE